MRKYFIRSDLFMFSKKISTITPSYTIGISTKVNELKNQGLDIINLSIGEPDFFTPTASKEKAIEAINNNKTKYDSASGLKDLRAVIQNKLKLENNINYDIDEIIISSGAKHAITNTLITFIDNGDEVIIPKPYWVSYPEMVKLIGGKPVFIDTNQDQSFKLTASALEKHISNKTKLLFITNPSNPTGAVYTKSELESIVDVCIKNNVYIIADEIYEKICYKDNFVSIASLSDSAKKITITINGLSKSAAMTGWRIGYSACHKDIAKVISSVQGHLVSHPSTISQWAAYGALTLCEEEIEEMVGIYKTRRDKAISILSSIKKLSFVNPEGAFYLFIDISKLRNKFKYEDSFSIEFCNRLLEDYGVAAVPGIAFGMDDYIRLSYACSIEETEEGLRRLKAFIESL